MHDVNPLLNGNLQMGTLENNEDPDEITHRAAFHQGVHCFLKQNRSSVKEIQYNL